MHIKRIQQTKDVRQDEAELIQEKPKLAVLGDHVNNSGLHPKHNGKPLKDKYR